jgi:hypothetical protein
MQRWLYGPIFGSQSRLYNSEILTTELPLHFVPLPQLREASLRVTENTESSRYWKIRPWMDTDERGCFQWVWKIILSILLSCQKFFQTLENQFNQSMTGM